MHACANVQANVRSNVRAIVRANVQAIVRRSRLKLQKHYRYRKPCHHYYRKTLRCSRDPSHQTRDLDLDLMRARENCLDNGFVGWVGWDLESDGQHVGMRCRIHHGQEFEDKDWEFEDRD